MPLPQLPLHRVRRAYRAFTLVELLVVIAIIGVLVALLLPAVQSAREAARRIQCANNIRQLGLALSMYHDSHQLYPAGALWWGPLPNRVRYLRGSMLIRLLPYIEEQAVFDLYDFDRETDLQTIPGSDRLIAMTTIDTFLCPSDGTPSGSGGRAVHNYSGSKGTARHINSSNCSCATWNSWNSQFATASYEEFQTADDFPGMFTRTSLFTRQEQVQDGLSKTIFMGEVRPACSVHANNGWSQSNNGQGLVSTIVPINFNSCLPDSLDGCKRPCNWNMELGFKSSHPGGVHVVMGDGSVRFLGEYIDMRTYGFLGDKADGQVAVLGD